MKTPDIQVLRQSDDRSYDPGKSNDDPFWRGPDGRLGDTNFSANHAAGGMMTLSFLAQPASSCSSGSNNCMLTY
jgi:hypothetical protein